MLWLRVAGSEELCVDAGLGLQCLELARLEVFPALAALGTQGAILGGSWVVITGAISRVSSNYNPYKGTYNYIITVLIPTHSLQKLRFWGQACIKIPDPRPGHKGPT